MKKLLVFAVLASFSLAVSAQEENVRFGVKAGVNFADISGDVGDNVSGRTGFHLGALVEIPISEKFAFAPEFIYSTQGAESEFSETFNGITFSENTTTKLNYLNLPLMVKYYVAEGLSIQAGPQIGFLLSANAEGEENDNGVVTEFDEDIKDGVKGMDFGLNFGLGYQLDMGVFFDARYNLGISDINDLDLEPGEEEPNNQNSVIQLSVGYKF